MSSTMRARSDHDPNMVRAENPSVRKPPRNGVTFRAHHAHFVSKNTTFCAPDQSGSYRILRQPRKVTVEYTKFCTCHENWMCKLAATSANIAPAMKSDTLKCTKYCTCHENIRKLYVQLECNFIKHCACPEEWQLNFTKYCTCHEKMTLELHQILHLPRKLSVQLECNFTKYCACHEKCTILLLY